MNIPNFNLGDFRSVLGGSNTGYIDYATQNETDDFIEGVFSNHLVTIEAEDDKQVAQKLGKHSGELRMSFMTAVNSKYGKSEIVPQNIREIILGKNGKEFVENNKPLSQRDISTVFNTIDNEKPGAKGKAPRYLTAEEVRAYNGGLSEEEAFKKACKLSLMDVPAQPGKPQVEGKKGEDLYFPINKGEDDEDELIIKTEVKEVGNEAKTNPAGKPQVGDVEDVLTFGDTHFKRINVSGEGYNCFFYTGLHFNGLGNEEITKTAGDKFRQEFSGYVKDAFANPDKFKGIVKDTTGASIYAIKNSAYPQGYSLSSVEIQLDEGKKTPRKDISQTGIMVESDFCAFMPHFLKRPVAVVNTKGESVVFDIDAETGEKVEGKTAFYYFSGAHFSILEECSPEEYLTLQKKLTGF